MLCFSSCHSHNLKRTDCKVFMFQDALWKEHREPVPYSRPSVLRGNSHKLCCCTRGREEDLHLRATTHPCSLQSSRSSKHPHPSLPAARRSARAPSPHVHSGAIQSRETAGCAWSPAWKQSPAGEFPRSQPLHPIPTLFTANQETLSGTTTEK